MVEKSQISKIEKFYTHPYYISQEAFQSNQALFGTSELRTDERMHQVVATLVKENFNRPQTIKKRQAVQDIRAELSKS